MTQTSIEQCKLLAVEFIKRADATLKDKYPSGKLSGALRRQSLELTRALAEMRKSW